MEMEQRLGHAIPPPGGGTTIGMKTGGGGLPLQSPKCELDSKGCLTLASILESFSVISEEHAWALCYQCAKCGKNILNDPTQRGTCLLVTHTDHLLIHRDGQVHPDTFITDLPGGIPGKGPPRTKCSCECKIIANLAAVIFHALDFGLAEDEERHLSAELESLLDAMASAGESAERPETDDEGIERDSGDSDDDRISSRAFNFDSILDICTRRLGSSASSSSSSSTSNSSNNKENNSTVICNGTSGGSSGGSATTTNSVGASASNNNGNSNSGNPTADAHYKAVCRALVAEALELSTFLQKVAQGTQQLRSFSSGYSSQRSGYSSAFSNHHSSGYSGFNSLGPMLDHDPDLDKLNFTDWARLWVQVIRELRNGVKLKKVDSSYHDCSRGPPIEYELTPYEILMDDIRSRRYKLNKVMVDGSLPPRIKKDAHAIILEFIRSRPPLKKVTDRVLPPPPKKQSNPIELLMESIRQEHHLRPINRRKESNRARGRRLNSSCETRSMTENNSPLNNNKSSPVSSSTGHPGGVTTTPTSRHDPQQQQSNNQQQQPQRRLIKADLDLLYSFDTKDEDDEDEEDEDDDEDEAFSTSENKKTKTKKKKKNEKENGSDSSCFFGHICPEGTQSSPATPWKKPADPKIFEDEDSNGRRVDFRRRHTICNPTNREEHGSTLITFPFEYTNTVNVFSSLQCPRASPILHRRKAKLPHSVSKSYLQEEFFQSNHWQTAIECLSLNLEEVVHIRNVLTKAELESLPVDCSLKEDVEKGKVCFLCLKTRFSLLFGPWGNTCKLCKRTVCAKCCAKMRIPTEHFAKVPVSTLSPSISPRDEEKDFIPKSLTPTNGTSCSSHRSSDSNSLPPPNMTRKNSVGSAPTSPNLSSRRSLLLGLDSASDLSNQQQSRSISPAGLDSSSSDQDRYSPDHHHSSNGPHSLPTVTSISLGLMAFKKRNFGRGKDADKTEKLKGSLMVVCHDCKAMVLQIIRSSRAKKANTNLTASSVVNPSPHHPRTNLPLELAGIRA